MTPPDCLEISHDKDIVIFSVRENGVTTTVRLPGYTKADTALTALQNHIEAANAYRKSFCAPAVIEYEPSDDVV